MRRIIYDKPRYGKEDETLFRCFHIITHGGACYGRLEKDWSYVHYKSHYGGTDWMVDIPTSTLMKLVRGKINWAAFEDECYYYYQQEQEGIIRGYEPDNDYDYDDWVHRP